MARSWRGGLVRMRRQPYALMHLQEDSFLRCVKFCGNFGFSGSRNFFSGLPNNLLVLTCGVLDLVEIFDFWDRKIFFRDWPVFY